jgi:hypothetical protein
MLHVFIKKHPLAEHFFEGLDREGDIRIISYPFVKHGRLNSHLRNIEAYLLWWLPHSWCYDAEYLSQLRSIKPDDAVLYFSIENRKTLQLTRKFVRARKQSVWLWDPIRSYRKTALSRWVYKRWLNQAGLKAYTFDPGDAKAYGLELTEQVFRHDPVATDADTARDISLYFIGSDKRRLAELIQWKQLFEEKGLSTHFHIVADKRTTYRPQDAPLLTSAWMPYASNIELVRRSKCLLELLQCTQSGPTMRSIEALFFDCKLITNNASIVDCEFYHPSRFFVIGQGLPEDLPAFLQSPAEPVCKELLRKHEIRAWLRKFE